MFTELKLCATCSCMFSKKEHLRNTTRVGPGQSAESSPESRTARTPCFYGRRGREFYAWHIRCGIPVPMRRFDLASPRGPPNPSRIERSGRRPTMNRRGGLSRGHADGCLGCRPLSRRREMHVDIPLPLAPFLTNVCSSPKPLPPPNPPPNPIYSCNMQREFQDARRS